MALNYSTWSLTANNDCATVMRGGGCWSEEASPLSSCGVNSLWWDELEVEEEEGYCDPVDLLPTDPFGMNIETTFTAAIASCIGDLSIMSGAEHFCGAGPASGDAVFADLSYCLNWALAASWEPRLSHGGVSECQGGRFGFDDISGGRGAEGFMSSSTCESCPQSVGFMEKTSSFDDAALVRLDMVENVPVQEESVPHEGMLFALGYLGVRDILSVEMVCKSLCSAVRNDPLLWQCIHICSHLSEKISDDDFLCLTQKCPGALQCLSLVGCSKITDQGLKAVLESNPRLTKLSILGCVRLTIEGLIANLKLFNMQALVGITSLRVGKLFSVSKEHYEELLSLLNINKLQKLNGREQRFYHVDQYLPDCGGRSGLDIEMCPTCQNYKLVYDCPAEGCKNKRYDICRGCDVCIPRCVQCGECIRNSEYYETFFMECLCTTCSSVTQK